MALRLLRDGFRCVLAGNERPGLDETVARAGEAGERADVVLCDVRVPDDRDQLIAHAAQRPGSLYGLVNNAGVARAAPLLDESLVDWRDSVETNLEAAFFLSQRAFEHMRRHGEGRVVNIGSIYGMTGMDNRGYGDRAPETTPGDRGPVRQSAYAASKGGLIQLTRDLAAAVGRWNITVNAVSPGSVPWANEEPEDATTKGKPGLGDRIGPGILRALAGQVPLRRLGRADEIAGPVSFLLSADASYVNGHNLVVDGGFTSW